MDAESDGVAGGDDGDGDGVDGGADEPYKRYYCARTAQRQNSHPSRTGQLSRFLRLGVVLPRQRHRRRNLKRKKANVIVKS